MNPVKDRFYYVYIIQSLKSSRWYTGYTNNLRKRFNEHQKNLSTYTKGRGPFKLIYYEASSSKEDAQARERYLKSGMGKRYLKNRLKRSLSLTG
ncbi:MAG: GIY-YIG nuclease family protein [Chlamydiota bacterium]|nr:GIY-YIG nuclease family protein [Chlamydiota bacterium]